jgi:FKBP-type peptidyl-prolyl cis-trans isomerase FkpA
MTVTAHLRVMCRLVGLLAATGVLVAASACGSKSPVAPDQSNVAFSTTDLTVGTGADATAGKTATVQYNAFFYSDTAADHKGAQFDSGTFPFVLGANQVIRGFDMAVTGMKVGGTRRAVVPPSLAYGTTGSGPVPPNAALVFDIALTNVQ